MRPATLSALTDGADDGLLLGEPERSDPQTVPLLGEEREERIALVGDGVNETRHGSDLRGRSAGGRVTRRLPASCAGKPATL